MKKIAVVSDQADGSALVDILQKEGQQIMTVIGSSNQCRAWSNRTALDEQAMQDYQNVLEDAQLNAIFFDLSSFNATELITEAIAAGKDVWVASPFVIEPQAIQVIQTLAVRRQAMFVIELPDLVDHRLAQLKHWIQRQELGEIRSLYATQFGLDQRHTFEPMIQMMQLLNQRPQTVTCHGRPGWHGEPSDMFISQLTFDRGIQGHVIVSPQHPTEEERLVVVGDSKTAIYQGGATPSLVLHAHHRAVTDAMSAQSETVPTLADKIDYFLEGIEQRHRLALPGIQSEAVIDCLRMCEKSLATGQPVTLMPQETATIDLLGWSTRPLVETDTPDVCLTEGDEESFKDKAALSSDMLSLLNRPSSDHPVSIDPAAHRKAG